VRDGVNVLEAYLAMARQGWQSVTVSDEPDAGPAGYHGQTHIPEGLTIPADPIANTPARHVPLDHPLAGVTVEATEPPAEPKKSGKGGAAGPSSFDTWQPTALGRFGAFMALQLGLGALLLTMGALIQTAVRKNLLAAAYAADSVSCALYSTVPGASAGTELTGGSPAYARITPSWGSASNGVIATTAMTFNVASGSTVAGFGLYNGSAVYHDGASLTSQAFASQGTYALTVTYTQT